MPKYTVTISDAEAKALLTEMTDIGAWLENWAHHRAGQLIAQIVEMTTDKRAAALTKPQREAIVTAASVTSAAERTANIAAEMAEKG
jgi:hypothetical protein